MAAHRRHRLGDIAVAVKVHQRLTLQGLGVWDGLPTTAIEHIHISHQGGLGRTLIDAAELPQRFAFNPHPRPE